MKRLALFAKPPVVGRVKTRLSPALPSEIACRLYRALLEDTIAELDEADADEHCVWWTEPAIDGTVVNVPKRWRSEIQVGADLGQRLQRAFAVLLEDGAHALIVGADCPGLSADHLGRAFAALADHDVVIGPAADGGYYLIGLARRHAELFEGISWSTDTVLAETLERARRSALRVRLLETLDDLDTPADLVRWIERSAMTSGGARLRRVLHQAGLAPPGVKR